ncbi:MULTISPECIES: outer membrane protein OmpW [Vibrio]|uniref:Outer membrane protein W n=2 Tax=Vibrio TaxID=662 RepID=A0A7X4LH94_9VIBR|nr:MULTISPECIES: outer membrane protein OmpW [Vibrio]MBF9003147.1 outer membrane protein OmpW [Vibrio nitrifigilis]MZI91871.1 outer membrane protein OmpW [Vibrio eleionomae]
MKKTLCGLAVLSALVSTNVLAHQQGDIFVRAGIASVIPLDSSDRILGSTDKLAVNTNTQLGLTFDYMVTDHIGLELLAATPFEHDISTGYGSLGDVATTKQLPPTLMVEYYFNEPAAKWQPYAGLGINYTNFYDSKFNSTGHDAGLSDLNLDNSWGYAANIGVDYQVNDNWLVNASLWYADIDTTAHYSVGDTRYSTDVDINPIVFMASVGYTF